MLIYITLFLFGLLVGSFLNVVVYRETADIKKSRKIKSFLPSWVVGRSYCDFCHKKLKWYENIPLISYLFLKGKCHYCGKKIPLSYPLIELLTALEFVWIYWLIQRLAFFEQLEGVYSFLVLAYWLFIFTISIALTIIDMKTHILPDSLVIPAIVVSLLRLVITGRWEFLITAITLFAFFLFLYLITEGKGIGFGDVKLSFFIGLTIGWWQWTLVGIFIAFLTGAFFGVILIISGKSKLKSAIAFGPFLLFGMLTAKIFGEFIWKGYMGLMS